jgi:hypothetical protein
LIVDNYVQEHLVFLAASGQMGISQPPLVSLEEAPEVVRVGVAWSDAGLEVCGGELGRYRVAVLPGGQVYGEVVGRRPRACRPGDREEGV